jgi:uroporphyrinogen-III synthase
MKEFFTMPKPLEGRTIALAEARQLEELAQMLEDEGATTLRCPMLSILDAPEPGPVLGWLRELCEDRFAYVVLMTGEALRRLLHFAEQDGCSNAYIAALARTRIITRGPKPGQVLKEIGLAPTRIAQAPTTDGVIATLRSEPLQGRTVGVTLYGEPNPALEQFLISAGAQVHPVMPYIYAPATEDERVADLIARLERGEVDVLLFTSSSQVDRVYEVAERRGMVDALRHGLARTRIAAVGPVLAAHLCKHGIRVDICPEQGFVMRNLVQHIKRALTV